MDDSLFSWSSYLFRCINNHSGDFMQIEGFKCPKCGKAFDMCKLLHYARGRIFGVCKKCDLICFLENYQDYLNNLKQHKQRRLAMLQQRCQKGQIYSKDYPISEDFCLKKKTDKFNPSER